MTQEPLAHRLRQMAPTVRANARILVVLTFAGCGGSSGAVGTGGEADGAPGDVSMDAGGGGPDGPLDTAGANEPDGQADLGSGPLDGSSADVATADRPADSGAMAGGICSSEKPCAGSLFCELPRPTDGGCGKRFVTGTCVARPTTCPTDGSPVCGCDGVTYQSDCLRQKAGVPLASSGACQGWEKGPISCGTMTCGPTQVCVQPGSHCGAAPPCDPAPDGGTCRAGLVACTRPGGGAGCTYSCAPPPPYCLDVPVSCRSLPTCACLQPNNCNCDGIRMGRVLVCGSAA
jgi:hypothetical protein